MKLKLVVLFTFLNTIVFAQNNIENVLTLTEFLGYVKSFHPFVKQANLNINKSEAKLLKARGAFDPKLDAHYNTKSFKDKTYYNKFNGSFKIPTWYGIELKAALDNNSGEFLNPEQTTPNSGLYAVGISASVLKDVIINKRMAQLKQAKLFIKQTQADRQLAVNNVIFNALKTYFYWLKTYNEQQVYSAFLNNAQLRFNGIKRSVLMGDKPYIDTLEAHITVNTRKLNLEKARIKFVKSSLQLSNYLWLENNTPIELQPNIIPDVKSNYKIDENLNINQLNTIDTLLTTHPKLTSLNYKYKSLLLEKRLKNNNLLPDIDINYNFLSQTNQLNQLNTTNYKSGFKINFPLFLRKERAELKLAKLKLLDTQLEINTTTLALSNKINGLQQELNSYNTQNTLISNMINDYNVLLKAEERKFELGESSLFLINSRESKLIDAKLKAITLENDFLNTKAKLFNALGNTVY